jgi:SWI/SNF-related matrix-associated actin-dependent regulator of chromatin subfamily A member 5
LQTISLLAYLRESRGVKGPHLVVVPKSVVGNWIREFNKWCPCIKATKMGGTKEERLHFITHEYSRDPKSCKYLFDVLVTSYEGLLKEKGRFSRIDWKYLIIDEAHRIKNEKSSLSLAIRTMQTQFRLLITGTPLQNNLRELWALLNFLMPDIFGDADQFDEWFSLSDESGKENVIKKLHTILRPFMLRRVKSDVAKSLPPKKETKLYVGLTAMQHTYYVHCLLKDAHELNKLGGPDRSRLLNVLMQLRKVCNHPYLFDGAEKGPPYIDGPHLWENSGKMSLLHKLLPKLQAQGSRILIFSQMTRVLDILEDYLRLLHYEYCRIDGNTTGIRRDEQVDEFNSEGSSKFVFLLSTRAGGLGINLATADIVILFDSDWNPQVDLQAMDRAHRIGQTKPVQVFRFITEGTVEEKIIERADRKLYLDAAVIQQGRLAEQNSSLEKGELMKMVRFGADQIVSGKGGTYTDEDIDALIARGEAKTSVIQAQLETNAQHSLANFSLMAEDDGTDTFSFGGVNYRGADKAQVGNFINLPQRQRKRNYDLGANDNVGVAVKKTDAASKKKRKGPVLNDFQLFDMDRLNEILKKEETLASDKDLEQNRIAQLRQEASNAPTYGSGVAPGRSREELLQRADHLEKNLPQYELTEEEKREKSDIYASGFPDWSRKDFKIFCTSVERHGRYVVLFTTKPKQYPFSTGLTPAHSYNIPYGFTFDELYQLNLTGQTVIVTDTISTKFVKR